MDINEWIKGLIGEDSYRAAAVKADTTGPTITRQLQKGHLSPEMVIALCRAYDRSPVQGLVETGYINEYEVEGVDLAIALHDATNEQLLNEIMRRSDPEARYLFGADGDSEVVDIDDAGGAAVFDIQKARVDPSDYDDGTVREFDYDESEYAADSSPDEQKIREERGEDPID
ncbi:DNA-binding protein [Corynebacterium accolens]|uniref:DNA-binding protein n=1 Tax=Corynebacterium accolens TaxID=38284 RepID=UPI00266FB0C4|nr:DNA-binding protein [Corynebacterium accolens]WKS69799.1 DNA-binding protein [Corynebacterium accolens]WKS72075.1 DNA-binding protein [Corynebacterium accolens]WKS74400.1 DNA-binding protein [Corynebacterium accolens]